MDGVNLTPLKQIYNPNGDIFHSMKKSDNGFDGFGEAYFTTINQNSIKGWKKHTKMTLNLVVINGEVEFIIYDDNQFLSIKLSPKDNYQRLTIEPNLWVSFRGLGSDNIILNIANIEHNPDEAINIDLEEIEYEW